TERRGQGAVAGGLGVAQALHPHRPGTERQLTERSVASERAPWRTLAVTLVAAAAFGVVMAVIKGNDTGVRDAIGNASAPWVVIPFLAGTRFRSVWHGVLIGVAATLAAFAGFYTPGAAWAAPGDGLRAPPPLAAPRPGGGSPRSGGC